MRLELLRRFTKHGRLKPDESGWGFLFLVALNFVHPLGLHAGEVSFLQPVKDNTIFSESGEKSSAISRRIYAGKTSGKENTDIRRGLLAFDLADRIPEGSVIESVTVTLTASQVRTDDPLVSVSVHRMMSEWGEGNSQPLSEGGRGVSATTNDATWTHRFFGTDQTWDTPGGDFVPEPSATVEVGVPFSQYAFSSEELVADVQAWVDDPSTNFGWMVLANEETGGRAKAFESREGSFQQQRPKLNIVFSPETPVQNPFSALADLGGSWRDSPALGLLNDSFFPWIFHLQHNWLFVVFRSQENDLFLFDPGAGSWWFTSETNYPNMFSFARSAWVFYFLNSSAPRHFVDLQSGEFFDLP